MVETRAVGSYIRYGTLELVAGVSGDQAEGLTLICQARNHRLKKGSAKRVHRGAPSEVERVSRPPTNFLPTDWRKGSHTERQLHYSEKGPVRRIGPFFMPIGAVPPLLPCDAAASTLRLAQGAGIVLCPVSCVLCPVSCVLCPVSCVLCPVSSVLCPVSSVLCPLSSVLCPLSSILYPRSSALGPRFLSERGNLPVLYFSKL
jgi:hypothetical protein